MEKVTLPNSTAALILGISSIVTCACYGVPGIITGIIAIVLANKAKKLYNENPDQYNGYGNAKAGKICGLIGLVLSVISVIYYFVVIVIYGAAMTDALMDLQNMN